MELKQTIEELKNTIGYGDVLEGTKEGTIVVINDCMLVKATVQELNARVDGEVKLVKNYFTREYIILSEVESVRVVNTKNPCIYLEMKSGIEKFFDVAESTDLNVILTEMFSYVRKAINKK